MTIHRTGGDTIRTETFSGSPLAELGVVFPEWMANGLCAQTDPESFFPDKGGSTREAKATCARCPVAAECLDYALENEERFGIWGGLSERERRKVLRAMGPKTCAFGTCEQPARYRPDGTKTSKFCSEEHQRWGSKPPADRQEIPS